MPAETANSSSNPRPRLPPLGAVFTLLCEAAGHRAELASLELREAREHLVRSLVLGAIAAGFFLMTGMALTLLLAALAWNAPHREWWLAAIFAFDVLVTTTLLLVLLHRLRKWAPLAETQHQLQRDQQCLTALLRQTFP